MSDSLDSLSALNDDEWANMPYLIELRGGPRRGKRFLWHDLPMVWHEPIPVDVSVADYMRQQITAVQMPIAYYREANVVTDYGAHIYEWYRSV